MIISPAFGVQYALVVFVDHTECHWLRALKPGFRHCFVTLQHGSAWVICDSLKSHLELTLVHPPEAFDLAQCYADQGHRVLLGRTALPAPRTGFPIAPLTCVTIAKRLLGVRAPRVWTPWQLFRHLANAQPGGWRLVPANQPSSKLDKQR